MNTEELNEELKEELNKIYDNINFEKVIDLINQGANVNLQSDKYYRLTALHYAIDVKDNEKIIELLINAGANVNLQSYYGYTALYIASEIKDNEKTIELLINAGANVNLHDKLGYTALHNASYINDTEKTVELLINAGANVNLQSYYGFTALHVAIKYKNIKCIPLLYIYHYHSIEQKLEYNIISHFAYHEYRNRIETLCVLWNLI